MSEYVGSRFGQDLPARIAASTVMLVEATDTLPGEPMYQPLIPFYPGGVVSGDSLASASSLDEWSSTPSSFDLTFYEGDDVVIPIYVVNESNPDMSSWEWHSQVRLLANYKSTLVHEFIMDAQFVPADPPTPGIPPEMDGTTLVQLFLPRELNIYWGDFEWELYSVSFADYGNFDKPDDWPEDEVWPPETTLKTWLYGDCKILLRTTSTDELPAAPKTPDGNTSIVLPAVNAGVFIVGPNGRVP